MIIKKIAFVLVLAVAVSTANAVPLGLMLHDNFDTGYVAGSLTGQTATNGNTWTEAATGGLLVNTWGTGGLGVGQCGSTAAYISDLALTQATEGRLVMEADLYQSAATDTSHYGRIHYQELSGGQIYFRRNGTKIDLTSDIGIAGGSYEIGQTSGSVYTKLTLDMDGSGASFYWNTGSNSGTEDLGAYTNPYGVFNMDNLRAYVYRSNSVSYAMDNFHIENAPAGGLPPVGVMLDDNLETYPRLPGGVGLGGQTAPNGNTWISRDSAPYTPGGPVVHTWRGINQTVGGIGSSNWLYGADLALTPPTQGTLVMKADLYQGDANESTLGRGVRLQYQELGGGQIWLRRKGTKLELGGSEIGIGIGASEYEIGQSTGWVHTELSLELDGSGASLFWDIGSSSGTIDLGSYTYLLGDGVFNMDNLFIYYKQSNFAILTADNFYIENFVLLDGDVDGDGFVGGTDLSTIIGNWGLTGATRQQGDLDGSGTVGAGDYTEVVSNWGSGTPPPEPPSGIPEPATLGLLLFGGLALLRRRVGAVLSQKEKGDVVVSSKCRCFEAVGRRPVRLSLVVALLACLALTLGLAGKVYAVDGGYTTAPVTYYNPNTTVTTNFFPVMWYGSYGIWSADNHGWLNRVTGNTVACTLNPDDASYNALQSILDEAQSLDKKVVVAFANAFVDGVDPGDPDTYARITQFVNLAKTHEATLGYKLGDELTGYPEITPQEAIDSAAIIGGLDPNRQIWQVFGGGVDATATPYLTGTQVVCNDYYASAVGKADFEDTELTYEYNCQSGQYAVDNSKSYVHFTQAFGFDASMPNHFRLPCPAEYRHNVFQAIAGAGSRGMINYLYGPPAYGDPFSVFFPWEADVLNPVNAELATMTHAMETGYQAGTTALSWTLTAEDAAHDPGLSWDLMSKLMVHDDQTDEYFLIVTNNGFDSRDATVNLSGLPVALTTLTAYIPKTNETVTLQDLGGGSYQLDDTLAGHEVMVYRLNNDPMSLSMVEVTDPGAPTGYTAYDLMANDVDTNLGTLELVLSTDHAGDIYQNSLLDDPDVAAETFDTYVTIGDPTGPEPSRTEIVGAPVDIDPGSSLVWDDQDLSIAWAAGQGVQTGDGTFQIARVVLKNSASGSWTLMGWETNGLAAVELTADFGLAGDVNGDGFVGGGDLNAILSNWGLSGARRSQGDLTGEGEVGGADYNQVLSNWGAGTPPEPGAIPEPATLGLLFVGGVATLLRRRF